MNKFNQIIIMQIEQTSNKTFLNTKELSKNQNEKSDSFNLDNVGKLILRKIIQQNRMHIGDIIPRSELIPIVKNAVESSLVFMNEDFGAGVCISPKGYILTVAHAIEELCKNNSNQKRIMAFNKGEAIIFEIIDKNLDLDLALLKITKKFNVYSDKNLIDINLLNLRNKHTNKNSNEQPLKILEENIFENDKTIFPFSEIKSTNDNPAPKTKLFCIGNPTNENGKYRDFDPFYVSFGSVKGYMKDEVFGDYEKGALKHSCWTYWGHSGGPIFDYDGKIVGLHNSWNSSTGTRHGVSLKAIKKFMSEINIEI